MPPGYQIWKKQHLSFHWKKIILLSFFEQILAWKAWGALKSIDFKTFRRRDEK